MLFRPMITIKRGEESRLLSKQQLMFWAIGMLLVWHGGWNLRTAVEEALSDETKSSTVGYLASTRLALIIIGLSGVLKQNKRWMASAVIFFISTFFSALGDVIRYTILVRI